MSDENSDDAFTDLARDRIFNDCAKSWRSPVCMSVILNYRFENAQEAGEYDVATLEQKFECHSLCRRFTARLDKRTAAYAPGGIKTASIQDDVGEGFAFVLVLESPANIHPRIVRKIIADCWDHCAERIKSISIEDVSGEFAASVALNLRPLPWCR